MGFIKGFGGVFGDGDVLSLNHYVAEAYDRNAQPDKTFLIVELGTYLGYSASILSSCLEDKPNVKIITVDNCKGTSDNTRVGNYFIAKDYLEKVNCKNVTQVVEDSIQYSKKIDNNSIDFLFIDSDHSYNYFIKELEAWVPKVKKNGYICGHDYDKKFESATPRMLAKLKEMMKTEGHKDTHGVPLEYIDKVNKAYKLDEYDNGRYAPYPRLCMHGGIVLGVNEFFGREPETFSPFYRGHYTTVWAIKPSVK